MSYKLTTKSPLFDQYPMIVDVGLIRRAVKFSAKNDVRYYINSVCIQPSESGGVLVVATNGHCALVLHDKNGKADKTYILPFSKDRNDKALSMRDAAYVVVSSEGSVNIVDFAAQKRFICPEPLIDAKYPDIKAVVGTSDEYEAGIKGAVNPAYMQLAIDSAGKNQFNAVKFYSKKSNGENAAILFTTENGFGLVMPMRYESSLERTFTKDFGGVI